MSRPGLSDLLNPAPSSTRESQSVQPIDTASGHDRSHLPSLASPLEGLALAATERPSTEALREATAESHKGSEIPNSALSSMEPSATLTKVESENEAAPLNAPSDVPMTDTQVKQEPVDSTPLASTSPAPGESVPGIKSELMTNEGSTLSSQASHAMPSIEKPRATPKTVNKKTAGATKKAPPKKRKAEPISKDGTPTSSTPAVNRTKLAANAQSSPARSLGEDDEDEGDEGVFCVCRGPDDHTWMIGCDGECEDWFHGRCVDMKQEDADLIDKYICPNCAKKGMGVTTWKPMCRLDGCRKPARVSGPSPSKYCSDEHGIQFMRQRVLQRSNRGDKQPAKKRRHLDEVQAAGTLQSAAETDESHQAYLRGGLLEPGELKALTDGVKDSAEFKQLGESVHPASSNGAISLENRPHDDNGPEVSEANADTCVPEEMAHLEGVLAKAAEIRHQLSALRDKERFLTLVKTRAAQVATELGKSAGETKKKDPSKDICGFDIRLSWSDVEFDGWRLSAEGQDTLSTGELGPPPAVETATDGDGDAVMTDPSADDRARGICPKKRCERHKAWYKLHQQEIAYDRRECEEHLARLGREAHGIGERAALRKLERPSGRVVNGVA